MLVQFPNGMVIGLLSNGEEFTHDYLEAEKVESAEDDLKFLEASSPTIGSLHSSSDVIATSKEEEDLDENPVVNFVPMQKLRQIKNGDTLLSSSKLTVAPPPSFTQVTSSKGVPKLEVSSISLDRPPPTPTPTPPPLTDDLFTSFTSFLPSFDSFMMMTMIAPFGMSSSENTDELKNKLSHAEFTKQVNVELEGMHKKDLDEDTRAEQLALAQEDERKQRYASQQRLSLQQQPSTTNAVLLSSGQMSQFFKPKNTPQHSTIMNPTTVHNEEIGEGGSTMSSSSESPGVAGEVVGMSMSKGPLPPKREVSFQFKNKGSRL
jgi:hypothetical protein